MLEVVEALLEKLEEANEGRIRSLAIAAVYTSDDKEFDEDYHYIGEPEYEARLVHALEQLKLSIMLPYMDYLYEEE